MHLAWGRYFECGAGTAVTIVPSEIEGPISGDVYGLTHRTFSELPLTPKKKIPHALLRILASRVAKTGFEKSPGEAIIIL